MEFEIRADRSPQGPRKLVRERGEYFRLMDQGLSNEEACERVGINYRTGRRWRNGRNPSGREKGAPPAGAEPPSPEPRRFLTEDERIHIAGRLREDAGIREIAAGLGRAPSTVSREVKRNAHPGSGACRPHAAQRRADGFGRGRSRRKSGRARSCGTTSRPGWKGSGARSRSAVPCAGTSPAGRRCT